MDVPAINKFGVEVECAVEPDFHEYDEHPPLFRNAYDGSLNSRNGATREYVSDPIDPKNEEIDRFEDQLRQLYSYITDVNSSMGLHIHISTTQGYSESLLKSYRFYEYFIDHLKNTDLYDNHERFRNRVQGSDYTHSMDETRFVRNAEEGANRYSQINFCALSSHGTVEFRVFPAMEDADGVMTCVGLACRLPNNWLVNSDFEFEHTVSGGQAVEEKTVTV